MVSRETWVKYKETHSNILFEELVTAYLPLVKFVASRLHSTLPSNIDKEDLESDGVFGLMEAIKRYDPERGVKFESFAVIRIRGSMIDKLRANDWVPRSVKSRSKEVKEAREILENEYDRPVTIQEISDHLDVSTTFVKKAESHSAIGTIGTLDAPINDENYSTVGESIESNDTLDANYSIALVRDYLVKIINGLSDRERIIFTLYYYENLPLSEIGTLMGITESRVCQIHGRAIEDARLSFQSLSL